MGTISLMVLSIFSNSIQSHADAIQFQNNPSLELSKKLAKQPGGLTMAMISDLQEKPAIRQTIQPIPLHTAELLNFIDKEKQVSASDVIKFSYPGATPEEINNTQGTFNESLSFIKKQGYNFTHVTGVPDWKVIVDELNAKRPILIHLKANGSYWLEQDTAAIIWGIQVFEYEGQPTNVLYFIRSLNHADNPIYSGSENNYDLLTNEKMHDPTLQVTYSWADTVYGFTK